MGWGTGILGAAAAAWCWKRLVLWRYRLDTQPDEVHFLRANDGWRLSLCRYRPAAEPRRHPVVICHGLGSSHVIFDLLPRLSLARFLAARGFDVWLLDLRGHGLSERPRFFEGRGYDWTFDDYLRRDVPAAIDHVLAHPFISPGLDRGAKVEPLSQPGGDRGVQVEPLSQPGGDRGVQVEPLSQPGGDRGVQVEPLSQPDGDRGALVEPPSQPGGDRGVQGGPLSPPCVHWVGHSMGGLLLYAHLSSSPNPRLRSGAALGSSLDYSSSTSEFHRLLKAQPLSKLLPAVPLGLLALYFAPFTGWVPNPMELFNVWPPNVDGSTLRRLMANGYSAVPGPLLHHLATAIQPGGLRSADGRIAYLDGLAKVRTPVLAIAGDHDRQCPPSAAQGTLDALGSSDRRLEVFGTAAGQPEHYGHSDLVIGRRAPQEVYPVVARWLEAHD